MTIINCSSNCHHQQDGKCMLESVTANLLSPTRDCVYYQDKSTAQSNTNAKK